MEIGDEVLMFGIIDGVSDDVLAHHFTEAGFNLLAIAYWQKAGEIARQRSANVETVNHLTVGWGSWKMFPIHRTKFLKKLHYRPCWGNAWSKSVDTHHRMYNKHSTGPGS